jgi:hypothetical protein
MSYLLLKNFTRKRLRQVNLFPPEETGGEHYPDDEDAAKNSDFGQVFQLAFSPPQSSHHQPRLEFSLREIPT